MGSASVTEVLRKARPTWSRRELVAAEAKLWHIGVTSVQELMHAMHGQLLNDRLRLKGFKAFGPETLQALRQTLTTTETPMAEAGSAAMAAPVAALVTPAAPMAAAQLPGPGTMPVRLAAAVTPAAPMAAAQLPGPGAITARPEGARSRPAESSQWSAHESWLWQQTSGLFDPKCVRRRVPDGAASSADVVQGRVSVVTPTMGTRQHFHKILWQCFSAQSWQNKELVIVETYQDQCSEFLDEIAKSDPRLIFIKFQRYAEADLSIGLKRNIGAYVASGEFIAHFDDDDIYAPTYLSTLLPKLVTREEAQAVTLKSWYIFDTETGSFGFCDPLVWGGMQGLGLTSEDPELQRRVDHWMYGYGFSYLYRRSAALESPFENKNLGEDFEFFECLRSRHGRECIALHDDVSGICLHNQHGENTSTSVAVWEVPREEVADLDVADLVVFDAYVWLFPRAKDGQHSRHIQDWTGEGRQLALTARRRLRELTLHTPFGECTLQCPKGALVRDVSALLEERLGALPVGIRTLRAAPGLAKEEEPSLQPEQRVGAHVRELWLQLPHSAVVGGDVQAGFKEAGPMPHSVRVCCPAAGLDPQSVSRVFHLDLPIGATVAELRRALPGLPADGHVFSALAGTSRSPLPDEAPAPGEVALSKFQGTVSQGMVVTRQQARWVQEALKRSMLQPDIQRKLDEFEQKAGVSEGKYRMLLKHLLNWEIYPPIVRHAGLSDDGTGPTVLWQGIGAHLEGDLELNEAWLELEVVMRNKQMAAHALSQVNGIRRWWGLPEL